MVQKLLLTRDAEIVSALVKDEGNVDNTLFENDPVALKTLAAMFKEIRDLENQGVKLTPEQIALKDVLDDFDNYYNDSNEDHIYYGKSGLYRGGKWANNPQLSRDFESAWNSAETTEAKQAVIDKFLNDPRVKEDKQFLYYLVSSDNSNSNIDRPFNDATFEQQKAIIELNKDNAKALAKVNLSDIPEGTTDKEKAAAKTVKEAYIEAAKALFKYETPAEGAKLDPANARYLGTILAQIDGINEAGEDGNDPDKAVIDAILDQFFVTTGEGENAVTTIKNFRRFTYEEMEGLADAVANYGSKEQCDALANMITVEDMEAGQFVRAIERQYSEGECIDNSIREQYARFIDSMTTKEEVLAFIDKMGYPSYHIPFDKIIEKFGNEPEVLNKILKHIPDCNVTRKKLVAHLVDNENNVTIPDGVDAKTLYPLLPTEKPASGTGDSAVAAVTMDAKEQALFKKIVDAMDTCDLGSLRVMMDKASQTQALKDVVTTKVKSFIDANKTDGTFMLDLIFLFPDIALPELLKQKPTDIQYSDDKEKTAISYYIESKIKVDQNPTDAQVKQAFANGWLTAETANTTGIQAGLDAYDDVDGLGTDDSFEELYCDQTRVNRNTIVDLIDTFNKKSKANDNMGFLARLNDDGIGANAQNRFIKALMRKAAQLGLQNTEEYQYFVNLFGAKGTMAYADDGFTVKKSNPPSPDDDTFEFTKHANNDTWDAEFIKGIDTNLEGLLNKVKLWTGRG